MKNVLITILIALSMGCNYTNNASESDESIASGDMTFADVAESSNDYKERLTEESIVVMENSVQEKKSPPPMPEEQSAYKNLKLIKNGTIRFESDNLGETTQLIKTAIQQNGAYASNESETSTDYRISKFITVRVPSDKFETLLAQISTGVEKFDTREISVSDVTEEFYDITARLKTKKEIEKRMLDLLKRAGKMTDVLEVEREIGNIRTEIERIEGRLRYLNDKVGLSTLTITYYETLIPSAPNESGFWSKIRNGFTNGWNMILFLFIGLANLWPLLLILGGITFFVLRKKKGSKKK